ncbi:MAG TPA: amidohydrolase family protein [Burkholderiales bacterium]|nr:amidohydrolase family protein [Burkholderiales bacterium]
MSTSKNAPGGRPGPSCACCPPRRDFLGKLAALGASAMLPGELMAQAGAKAHRIDVHHHLMYPGYLEEVGGRRAGSTFKWSPAMSIEDMDKSGIAVSVLSLIQPGAVTNEVEKGRKIARLSNEYGAQLARDHKGRFASFATLPLLDTEGALKEIGYALDTLKAEGIGLMTSYQDKYLGDASFAPIWEELNRRKAVIYTHPLSPDCCRNVKTEVPPAVVEYATDTTRTIASLVFSGTAARYPDMRWIFSHSGGTMPFLLSRFTRHELDMKEKAKECVPKGVMYELKKFHYDTAQGNHAGALAALMKIVTPSQVLYGTDFPFRDGAEEIEGLAAFRFNPGDLRAIERENALKLLPTLKA